MWREVFATERDQAEVEGLAAGTGLLTGDLAEATKVADRDCPRCGNHDEIEVETVDLLNTSVTRQCQSCGHTWTVLEIAPRRP